VNVNFKCKSTNEAHPIIIIFAIFAITNAEWSEEHEYMQAPEPAPMGPEPESDSYSAYITLGSNIAALVFGLLWIFVGYRLYKVVLFLVGFVVFFFILVAVLEAHASATLAAWLRYVIAAGAGLIGGFLFVLLGKVGFFLFGFVFGALVSAVILGATPLAGYFTSGLIPLIIILVTGLVVAIATVFLSRHFLIIGTSISGAYLVGTTADQMIPGFQTGASQLLGHIISSFDTKIDFGGDWKPYVILGGIVLLAIIGIVVQYVFTAKGYDHVEEEKKKNNPEYFPLLHVDT